MAPHPAGRPARLAREAPAGPRGWRGHHLHYHGDQDRLLLEMVAPTVAGLLARGEVVSFFFIRYQLGGPHVRLRLRPSSGRAESVSEEVRHAAGEFFRDAPSTAPVPPETVRRRNREILAGDPLAEEGEETVHPDNSLRPAPVRFEVERYGGSRLFPHSLACFALSSVAALEALRRSGAPSPSARLAAAARLSVRQAWGLARDPEEFTALVGWPVAEFGHLLPGCVARADEAFERRPEPLLVLLRGEIGALAAGGGEGEEVAGAARRLARETRDRGDLRRRIAAAHLHMAANRLGVLNTEELYLGRLLQRASREAAAAEPRRWREWWDAHRAGENEPGPPLVERARGALERFARGFRAAPAPWPGPAAPPGAAPRPGPPSPPA